MVKTAVIIPIVTNAYKSFYPSQIVRTYDKYFGEGYELYEYGYRHLITKELGQCYRKHAEIVKNHPNYFKELQKYYL